MSQPGFEAICYAYAVLLGLLIGVVYDLLLPLRLRFPKLSDLLFMFFCSYVWLILNFKICLGDVRISYCTGFLPGYSMWRLTGSLPLRNAVKKLFFDNRKPNQKK